MKVLQIQEMKIPPKMERILRKIYGSPASITLVSGDWKTGKTDFALLITQMVKQLGLISQFASNIETQESYVEFVQDFSHFDAWLYSNRYRKMFLYDETIESSPRRSAMSSLNVGWVKRIPQLSKGKCHLLSITQEVNLGDSIFSHPVFLRGHWRKFNKTNVLFYGGKTNRDIHFSDIPPCNIAFDPYRIAHFSVEDESLSKTMLPTPLKALTLYGQGFTLDRIKEQLGLGSREQAKREIRKGCKAVSVTLSLQHSEGKKLQDTCDKLPN